MRQQSDSSIEVPRSLEEVFSALVASGVEVGKVREQSKLAGYVIIRTPMRLFPVSECIYCTYFTKGKNR